MKKDTERRHQLVYYMLADLISTAVAMFAFNMLRYALTPWMHQLMTFGHFMGSRGVILSLTVFAPAMLVIYALSGVYVYNFSRSRTNEFLATLITSIVGALIYFLTAMLNDANAASRTFNYEQMVLLFLVLLVIVYTPRFLLTTYYLRLTRRRLRERNTLMVGTSEEAVRLCRQLNDSREGSGFRVKGYVESAPQPADEKKEIRGIPVYNLDQVERATAEHDVECLVIVLHKQGRKASMQLINRLFPLDLPMYLSPDRYNLLLSRSRFDNVAGEPLIDVSRTDQSPATVAIKRACDIAVSSLALLVSAPVIAFLAWRIRRESPGPVFYKQERIGYHKRPFNIYKLRSMRPDAEAQGPALSSATDRRVTRIGATMRKYRLDELPNFWNVLRGDMSLVGPRPEREHFIRQIVKKAPYYTLVHQVRPGITSWGMVKYGYASTVDQMVERLRYDMVYIENMSISVDIKILLYTINTVVTGRGV